MSMNDGSGTDRPVLWYTRCPMPTASSIAITDGWLAREFEPDGITVQSLSTGPAGDSRLSHYSHANAALFREGGVVPPLWSYASGAHTRLLAIGQEEGFRGLIVRADSDIVEPGDLRGKRIAVPNRVGQLVDFARAVSWRGVVDCLHVAGLEESDVVLVDVTWSEPFSSERGTSTDGSIYTARDKVRIQTAEVLALVRGEVDAIFTAGGYGLEVAALIDARVVVEHSQRHPWSDWRGNHLRMLTVSEALSCDRPDLVARYLATLQRAASWAGDHEREALRIVAAEVGVAEEWARLGYHPDTVRHLHLERSDAALGKLDEWAGFLAQRGFLARPVDVAEWLAPEVDLIGSAQA
jgi:ABC-type nitrate/sulfonate/bicarbonate transport system substrate-binding protein